jgi:hypothetical protein
VNVTALVAVFPAASATVTVYVDGVDAPLVHENPLDANGPPAGDDTVSAACVHPVVACTGNVADAAPEPASVTLATRPNDPAAFDFQ